MEDKAKENQNKPLIHDFNKKSIKSSFSPKVVVFLVAVVVVGLLSGYFISVNQNGSMAGIKTTGNINSSSVSKGTVVGSNDTATFKDTAEGILKEGGINGEGAFHLERNGGPSQNVYLTSASVDLSKFINHKIKVWGQTQKAQYAGWLMDVGRIEVL